MKQKKDFWDMSFNPVWGCLNNCPFCYARKIAKRYAARIAGKERVYRYGFWPFEKELTEQLQNFTPTWLESNYVRKFPAKPSIIFVNSMSDPAYWEQEWYERIVQKIAENMQHTFVVLTKQPRVYEKYTFPHNTIIGVSLPENDSLESQQKIITMMKLKDNFLCKKLISFEPIQKKIRINKCTKILEKYFDWIHVGQESGNRAGRIRATREMIEPFFDLADIPVFMKNNLEGICGDRPLRKEFPDG